MPLFQIEADGRRFEVEAPDMASAASVFSSTGQGAQASEKPADLGASWAAQHGIASGATFGLLDKAAAAMGAVTGLGKGGAFGDRYADNLRYLEAGNEATAKAHPVASTAGEIGGAIAAGRALPVLPAAYDGVVGRALSSAGTGALYGAGAGAANAALDPRKTAADAFNAGVTGGAVGGALGGAVSPLADAIGAGATMLARRGMTTPGGVDRGAADALSTAVENSRAGGLDPRRQLDALGPRGMIADLTGETAGLADAVANAPGVGGTALRAAANQRAQTAPAQVGMAADAAMGPRPANIETALGKVRTDANDAAAPYYDIFRTTPVPFTRDLEQTLSVIKNEPAVLAQARRYANMDPASGPDQFFARQVGNEWQIDRVPNATEWDYIKRGLDDLAKGSPNDRRIYGELGRRVRDGVDTAISPTGNPADSPWAIARGLAAEGFGNEEALTFGRKVWSPSTSRAQIENELAGMSPGERDLARAAARDAFQEMVDNQAASLRQIGDNADSVLAAKALVTPAARDKMAMLFGKDAADDLTKTLASELHFAGRANAMYSGSATAGRRLYQEAVPSASDAVVGSPTAYGDARKAIGYVLGKRNEDAALRSNADLGAMLTKQGPDAAALLDELVAYAQKNALAQKRGASARKAASGLLSAPAAASVGQGLLGR